MDSAKYCNLICSKISWRSTRLCNVRDCNVFVHDGAPSHRAKLKKNFLREENVNISDWPGNSPDSNPIESLWNVMTNKAAAQHPTSMESM